MVPAFFQVLSHVGLKLEWPSVESPIEGAQRVRRESERLEEIFVPFDTTKEGGAGIGLALARQVALAHGGRLTAPPNASRGMTFVLSIPVSQRG